MSVSMFTPIFEVITYAYTWMITHYVPGLHISFYALAIGGLVTTGLIDALKTFLPHQEKDD